MRQTWASQLVCIVVVTFSWPASADSPCVTLAGHQGQCASLRDCLAFHATSPKTLTPSKGKYDPRQCQDRKFCCPGLDIMITSRIAEDDSSVNKSLPQTLNSSEEKENSRDDSTNRANSDKVISTTAFPLLSQTPLPTTTRPGLFLRPATPLPLIPAPVPVSMDHPKVSILSMDKCGVSSVDYIVNGKHAARGQFPWMVLICYNSTESGSAGCLCGGSLINQRYVLTAAHCVTSMAAGIKLSHVKVGEHNEGTDPDCDFSDHASSWCSPPVQIIPIEQAIPHPGYSKALSLNDIALIRLARDVDLSDYVCPVCLPLGNIQLKDIDNVTHLIVAGWGKTQAADQSSVLEFAGIPAVPNAQCTVAYRMRRIIRPSQLCAGGAKEDSCSGDSGGPLVMPDTVPGGDEPRMVQVGLVSFGPKACGTIGTPGVYTRVGFYMDWILNNLES